MLPVPSADPAQDAFSEPYAELGPCLPPAWRVHAVGRELAALGLLTCELATGGPGGDLARALRQLDRARALLGAGFGGCEKVVSREGAVPEIPVLSGTPRHG